MACDQPPDHDTLAAFRRCFGGPFADAFVQVLQIVRETRTRALARSADDTRIHANASRHNALSHGRAGKIEARLKAEVQKLLALAGEADHSKKLF
jgi:hypothetical protein